MKRIVTIGAALSLLSLGTLGLAACGSSHDSSASGSSTSIAADADFNSPDVTFLQSMIPHHEQAIEMAELALDPESKTSAAVAAIATRIQGAQDAEIVQMKEWLTGWGQSTVMDTSDGHDMSKMEGMMSADEMTALDAGTGADFDKMWLAMMIEHHEGAITMAEAVIADGKNPDVSKLAATIASAQTSEITEMNGLLDT